MRRASTLPRVAAAGAPVLVPAACGGSPGGQPALRSGSPARATRPLAFSRCLRSHGVTGFPNPDSSGAWAKRLAELAASSPRFEAAAPLCGHLLPDGGPGVSLSPAVARQIQADMAKFAQRMRSVDRRRACRDRGWGRASSAGIDTNSPPIRTTLRECEHMFPARVGIPPGA
jgi:hypothetical protein